MAITINEPIVPEVGKKYYVRIGGLTKVNNPLALVLATVHAIGQVTISLDCYLDGRTRNTYLQGDVRFIEEVAEPEKAE